MKLLLLALLEIPLSLRTDPGVHIAAYDEAEHRQEGHYNVLCSVVHHEFAIDEDGAGITLVFINAKQQKTLNELNPSRFQSAHWYGIALGKNLILMIGEEESDDTFMHEYMHVLNNRGILFKNVASGEVHRVITEAETMLLGSESYLNYLSVLSK